jgi:imidazolonepropionase-like amidohydrolase
MIRPCAFQKRLRQAFLTAVAISFLGTAWAETIFINDATVHTVSFQGVLQGADILIRDGLIRDLGHDLDPPADATVIEAGGRPVTPGFFAGITALGLMEIGAVKASVDHQLAIAGLRPEFDISSAYNPHSTAIPVTRIEGYSWSLLGASRSGSIIGGQGRVVELDGGYRSFLGDSVLFIDIGGDASEQSGGSRAAQWMLLEQAMAEAGSEVSWSPDSVLTLAGRQTLAGFKAGKIVVFHADRASDILQVLEFAERHQMSAVISGGSEAWMVAEQLAEAGVPVIVDALSNLPGNFDMLGARLDNAAILHEAGVVIAFTTSQTHDARKLRQAAGNAVAHGLPYEAGIAAMTRYPATIFELEETIGILETDSRADLVIWSGDPLEVSSAADQLILNGKVIPMVSRQTLLRDRYLPQNPDLPRAYIKP